MIRKLAHTAAIIHILYLLPAYAADENRAFVTQEGIDNSGEVDQLGQTNQVGLDQDPAQQFGNLNVLSIKQTGSENRVGTTLNANGIIQRSPFAVEVTTNTIEINQDSRDNAINSIFQNTQIFSLGALNELSVRQGLNGVGNGNTVERIIQDQGAESLGQVIDVEQAGDDNTIALIEQVTAGPRGDGRNSLKIRVTGNSNGGVQELTGYALVSGADANVFRQRLGGDGRAASGNFMDLLVEGSFNQIGIDQRGKSNTVGVISLSPDSSNNEIGIRQDGRQNQIVMSALDSSRNNVGISQLGQANLSIVNINGMDADANEVLGTQIGSNDFKVTIDGIENNLKIDQNLESNGAGGENYALFDIKGDINFLELSQRGSNRLVIVIEGDSNNSVFSKFSIDFDDVTVLTPGELIQKGERNVVDIEVSGDENLFALSQNGGMNIISAEFVGDLNQALLRQSNYRNRISMIQNGALNSARIRQE
jgi:hypothetical protein